MRPRSLIAEFFGTFALTFAVIVTLNNPSFAVPTPVLAAITLGLFVYLIGPVSGCHLNPAVTIGILSIGWIGLRDAVGYVVVQFAGAGLALAVGRVFFPVPAAMLPSSSALTGFAELFGTGLLTFSVTAVVIGRVPGNLSGLVIGGGLLVGAGYAAHASNAVLNPAVALGIGSFAHTYAWGPIAGALVGALLGNFLLDPDAT